MAEINIEVRVKNDVEAYSAILEVDIIRFEVSVTELLSRVACNGESCSLLVFHPRQDI